MTQIVAYLAFHGNCREAMNFYEKSIGGSLNIMAMGDSPMGAQTPDDKKDWIMHSTLIKDGITLMASDMFGKDEIVAGNNINLCIVCSSEEEVHEYFNKLSEGGKVTHPPKVEFWGAVYADFTDKYSIRWMLNYEKSPAQ